MKTRRDDIEPKLMHGMETTACRFPILVSEKMDGIRCIFVPGDGFYSRRGIRWRDSVLAHIGKPNCDHWVDGELWSPELTRQEINEAVAIGRYYPGDAASQVKFYAFDVINKDPAYKRVEELALILKAEKPENFVWALHTMCLSEDGLDNHLRIMRKDQKCEGAMIKHIGSPYTAGRTGVLSKRKFWKEETFYVVHCEEGLGKARGATGAVVCAMLEGSGTFKVGTFQATYAQRKAWFESNPKVATIRYISLSRDGIPQNASVISMQ